MAGEKSLQATLSTPVIRLNGGVNEVSPVTSMPQNELVSMNNWRIDEDGMRMAKRNGVAEVAGINTAIGAKDVFGFATYYDNDSDFCQLVVAEDKIWRKIAAGSWTTIHTWSSTLAHPVKILHVQDKIIIVTEIQNLQILDNGGGNVVQLGITAPTTIPTLSTSFEGGATNILDDDMSYADTAAMNAVWTDGDSGGTSELSETDPNSTSGPDGDDKYMRFYDANPGTNRYARRYQTLSNIPDEYDLEFDIYFDDLGYKPQKGHFEVHVWNGIYHLELLFAGSYVYYHNGSTYVGIGWGIPGNNIRDRWYKFKLEVTESKFNFYVNGVDQGEKTFDRATTSNAGLVDLKQNTNNATNGDGDTYIDHIKISGEGSGGLSGLYRYAVTYARNGGNYTGESNPIKSTIGTATIVGAGQDDLTAGGIYTGSEDRIFWVKIDGTTPDTITWSDDAGETWRTTGMPITLTMYLSYGIILTWGAITGHTNTDYWTIACDACVANPANEQVSLSSIPTSSDTNQVNQRMIYRTLPGGNTYYHLVTINDNATTTFVDNIPDYLLGISLEVDHDIAPLGRYSEWWDDRLWIFDDEENIVYNSQLRYPGHFDTTNRLFNIRSGKTDDEGTGLVSYVTHLYAFKRDGIYFIRKQQGGYYGLYKIKGNIGCIAPWSLLEVSGLLTFVSYRGWEIFNGKTTYTAEFTLPLRVTLKTIDKTNSQYITSVQLQSTNEILLSIPDRTGGNSAITCVYNYKDGGFYTFSFSKTPSYLIEARDSSKELQVYMGTRDGFVGTMESGTQDFGSSSTATARIAWTSLAPKYPTPEAFEFEYEAPTGVTLLIDHYVNMEKDSVVQNSLVGSTPSATDRSIRLPIKNEIDYAKQGRYHAMKFTNAENVGDALKLNTFRMFYSQSGDFARGEIKGD